MERRWLAIFEIGEVTVHGDCVSGRMIYSSPGSMLLSMLLVKETIGQETLGSERDFW